VEAEAVRTVFAIEIQLSWDEGKRGIELEQKEKANNR
jgi:hypothetical protein